MTTSNALGFFLLGLAMIFLPAVAPTFFAANAMDGSNTSALWLMLMGFFQGSMGTYFILRNEAVPFAVRLMTLRLPTLKPAERAIPALMLRPLRGQYNMSSRSNNGQRLAA